MTDCHSSCEFKFNTISEEIFNNFEDQPLRIRSSSKADFFPGYRIS